MIKEYSADYYLHRSDVTVDFSDENRMIVHQNVAEPWRVTLVDTGLHTQTGAVVETAAWIKAWLAGADVNVYNRVGGR